MQDPVKEVSSSRTVFKRSGGHHIPTSPSSPRKKPDSKPRSGSRPVPLVMESIDSEFKKSKRTEDSYAYELKTAPDDLLKDMLGPDGIPLANRKWLWNIYSTCFVGSEAIDWFLSKKYVQSRSEGKALGQALLERGKILHVAEGDEFGDNGSFYVFGDKSIQKLKPEGRAKEQASTGSSERTQSPQRQRGESDGRSQTSPQRADRPHRESGASLLSITKMRDLDEKEGKRRSAPRLKKRGGDSEDSSKPPPPTPTDNKTAEDLQDSPSDFPFQYSSQKPKASSDPPDGTNSFNVNATLYGVQLSGRLQFLSSKIFFESYRTVKDSFEKLFTQIENEGINIGFKPKKTEVVPLPYLPIFGSNFEREDSLEDDHDTDQAVFRRITTRTPTNIWNDEHQPRTSKRKKQSLGQLHTLHNTELHDNIFKQPLDEETEVDGTQTEELSSNLVKQSIADVATSSPSLPRTAKPDSDEKQEANQPFLNLQISYSLVRTYIQTEEKSIKVQLYDFRNLRFTFDNSFQMLASLSHLERLTAPYKSISKPTPPNDGPYDPYNDWSRMNSSLAYAIQQDPLPCSTDVKGQDFERKPSLKSSGELSSFSGSPSSSEIVDSARSSNSSESIFKKGKTPSLDDMIFPSLPRLDQLPKSPAVPDAEVSSSSDDESPRKGLSATPEKGPRPRFKKSPNPMAEMLSPIRDRSSSSVSRSHLDFIPGFTVPLQAPPLGHAEDHDIEPTKAPLERSHSLVFSSPLKSPRREEKLLGGANLSHESLAVLFGQGISYDGREKMLASPRAQDPTEVSGDLEDCIKTRDLFQSLVDRSNSEKVQNQAEQIQLASSAPRVGGASSEPIPRTPQRFTTSEPFPRSKSPAKQRANSGGKIEDEVRQRHAHSDGRIQRGKNRSVQHPESQPLSSSPQENFLPKKRLSTYASDPGLPRLDPSFEPIDTLRLTVSNETILKPRQRFDSSDLKGKKPLDDLPELMPSLPAHPSSLPIPIPAPAISPLKTSAPTSAVTRKNPKNSAGSSPPYHDCSQSPTRQLLKNVGTSGNPRTPPKALKPTKPNGPWLISRFAQTPFVPASTDADERTLSSTMEAFFDKRIPTLCWFSNDPQNPLCGAVVLRSSRCVGSTMLFDDALYSAINDRFCTQSAMPQDRKVTVWPLGEPAMDLSDVYFTIKPSEMDLSMISIASSYNAILELCTISFETQVTEEIFFQKGHVQNFTLLVTKVLRHTTSIVESLTTWSSSAVLIQADYPEHATDGLIVSLCQIMVDPFFRTIPGFLVLLDKEWLRGSFPFHASLSLPEDSRISAPIQYNSLFFLFISCLFELLHLYPREFNWTERFLMACLDSIYSPEWATFDPTIKKGSFWDFMLTQNHTFFNSAFLSSTRKILVIPPNPSIVVPFTRYWLMYNFSMHNAKNAFNTELTTQAQKTQVFYWNRENIPLFDLPTDCISKCSKLEKVTVQNASLTSLPLALRLWTNLTVLNLDYNRLFTLSESIGLLRKLRVLSVRHNQLQKIPDAPMNLPDLQQLFLSSNSLTSLPNTIGHLANLQYLDLSHNTLHVLPSSMAQLVYLKMLDISHNCFDILPSVCTRSLVNIETLIFSGNGCKALPVSFSGLANLEVLIGTNNNLSSIPSSLGFCCNLKRLELGSNQIQTIPKEIGNCTSLTTLNLSTNQLSEVCSAIGNCVALETLVLSNNSLGNLPTSLKGCHLELLDISFNDFGPELPHSIGQLKFLKTLKFNNNVNVIEIPSTLASLANSLSVFEFENCPIQKPPEHILNEGLEMIMYHLKRIQDSKEPLYKVKLMIVGQENVGKTSLINQLSRGWTKVVKTQTKKPAEFVGFSNAPRKASAGPTPVPAVRPQLKKVEAVKNFQTKLADIGINFQNLSTDGIVIVDYLFQNPLSKSAVVKLPKDRSLAKLRFKTKAPQEKKQEIERIPDVTLSIWDFAGQEIYYTTHRFFLTEGALYLVVFNLTDQTTLNRVEFWINSLMAHHKTPTVIICGTHLDELNENQRDPALLEETLSMIVKRLRVGYPGLNVASIHSISCETGENIEELRNAIQYLSAQIVTTLPDLPLPFFTLDRFLKENQEKSQESCPVVTTREIVEWGNLCGITTVQGLQDCLGFLNRLGSVLFFPDDQYLKDLIILDPLWLSKMMTTLFTTKQTFVKCGVLQHSLLQQVWKEYPRDIHASLIYLLEKFELCFRIPKEREKEFLKACLTGERASQMNHMLVSAQQELTQTIISKRTSWTPPLLDLSGFSLLPDLVPGEKPSDISQLWSDFPQDFPSKHHFERTFKFSFLPSGLFSKTILSLVRLASPISLWKNGAFLTHDFTSTHSTTLFIMFERLEPKKKELDLLPRIRLQVRSDHRELTEHFFIRITNLFLQIISCWKRLNCSQSVRWPPDLQQRSVIPLQIAIEEIEELVIQGQNELKKGPDAILLIDLAPDLCLRDSLGLKKIPAQDLQGMEEPNLLGTGAYARVYKGTWENTTVAIKLFKRSKRLSTSFYEFRHEITIQNALNHPNIAKIFGFSLNPLALVLEFIPCGTLREFLEESQTIKTKLKLRIAKDLAKALNFMHQLSPPMAHLDIKSPNILLCDGWITSEDLPVVKLIDFGCAQPILSPLSNFSVDNPTWASPEMIAAKPLTEKADVYSFGLVLWELVTHLVPFQEYSFFIEIANAVTEGKRPTIDPSSCHPLFREIIIICWDQEPSKRPAFPQILSKLHQIQALEEP